MTTILNKEKILEQARIYVEEGRIEKAIIEYEKILMADPADLRVKLRIAELYTKRKQINDAIRIYREVASAYRDGGFYLKAVTVLKNILRLNPTLVDINQTLAELYERMDLTKDAVRQYNILIATLIQKGETGKVLETQKKVVDLSPDSETARIKLAEIYEREGMQEDAFSQYESLAKLYESQGRTDLKLADVYEKILSHREGVDINMVKSVCRIYDAIGEKKKVLKWIDQAKNIAMSDPELLLMQAKIYVSLNQLETARGRYTTLAEIEKEAGNIDGALNAYAEILSMFPGEDEKVYARAAELEEGADKKLKEIVDKHRREEASRQAAETRALEKEQEVRKEPKIEQKKVSVQKEKEIKPSPSNEKEAEALYNLGQAYLKMNLTDEAKEEFAKAKKIYEQLLHIQGEHKTLALKRLNEIGSLIAGKETKPEKQARPKKVSFI